MLKNFSKMLLMAGAASLIATPAMANDHGMMDDTAVSVTGKARAFFGMATVGKHATGYDVISEVNVDFKATKGPVKARYQIESREQGHSSSNHSDGTNPHQASIRQLTYQSGALSTTVGTCIPKSSIGFAKLSGTTTSGTKNYFWTSLTAKTESDGVCVGYKVGKVANLEFTMLATDALSKEAKGAGMQFGAHGAFGPIKYKVSNVSTTEAQTDASGLYDGQGWANSATNLGVMASFGAISLALDIQNKSLQSGTWLTSSTYYTQDSAATDLQVQAAVGPGKVIFTYANNATTRSNDSVYKNDDAYTSLVYNQKLAKGAKLYVLYGSRTNTADTSSTGTSTETAYSWMGAGLLAKF